MSISQPFTTDAAAMSSPVLPLRRFSVDEYQRMGAAGVLTEDDRVELLEGWIVRKMIRNPRHDATIELVQESLLRRLPAGWRLRVQLAITTADSEPEPDFAVVRGSARERTIQHPDASATTLVIEVAESSLQTDQGIKARIYSRAKISTYWIVNLVSDQLEVYWQPGGEGENAKYLQSAVYRRGQSAPLVNDGNEIAAIAVDELLP